MRIQVRAEAGTDGELIEQMAQDIRAHPIDPDRVRLYLEATSHRPTSLAWLGDVLMPTRAIDAYHLGEMLVDRAPAVAVRLLELALSMPLPDEDVRAVSRWQRASMPGEARRTLISWFRQALVRAYQKIGRADDAQRIMEQLAAAGGDAPMSPHLAQVAGQVQASSGQRVIESRIRKQEAENDKSPRYWLSRASYFSGRGEDREAIDAFEKALSLAPSESEQRFKVPDVRNQVLMAYFNHLVKAKRTDDAADLLRRELQQVPPETITAERAAYLVWTLDSTHGHPVEPADPVLWRYLERRKEWDHAEEKLLWKMLERTLEAGRGAAFKSATALARGQHPTRAKNLGWILTRMNEPNRAIPLIEDAVARLTEKDDLRSARFNLLEAYLDTNRWREAEALFPHAAEQLGPKELVEWHQRLAIVTARAGAKKDAMRIWKRVAKVDPADLRSLTELADEGLRDELRAYYRALAARDPKSWIPGRALELLR